MTHAELSTTPTGVLAAREAYLEAVRTNAWLKYMNTDALDTAETFPGELDAITAELNTRTAGLTVLRWPATDALSAPRRAPQEA